MYSLEANNCDSLWREAVLALHYEGEEQEGRHYAKGKTETTELLHVGMTVTDSRQKLVFSRPINPAFAVAEVIWILAGSNDLEWISFWNPTMKKFSDDGVTLRGAYGYRLGMNTISNLKRHECNTDPGFDQFDFAYTALLNVPSSRQVVMNIYNSNFDLPYDGTPYSKDIPCNLTSDLKVRDGKLHWLQTMRSNDLMWGTPYNFIQWTSLQEVMAGWLELELGDFTLVTSSLHVYDTMYEEFREALNTEVIDFEYSETLAMPYDDWHEMFGSFTLHLTECMQSDSHLWIISVAEEFIDTLTGTWKDWFRLLTCELLRRKSHLNIETIFQQSFYKELHLYYKYSWNQWLEAKNV